MKAHIFVAKQKGCHHELDVASQEEAEILACAMCAQIQARLSHPKKSSKKRKEYSQVIFRVQMEVVSQGTNESKVLSLMLPNTHETSDSFIAHICEPGGE